MGTNVVLLHVQVIDTLIRVGKSAHPTGTIVP
jgi:hypothetical protein